MNRLFVYIFWVALLAQSAAASNPATVRVYAKVDAGTTIYPGDQFVLSIVVEGGGPPNKVDISPLAPFNPQRAGGGTSVQTVNDRTTVSYSENYVITAGKAGKMTLPAVTVTVGNQTYTTNPVEVPVLAAGDDRPDLRGIHGLGDAMLCRAAHRDDRQMDHHGPRGRRGV